MRDVYYMSLMYSLRHKGIILREKRNNEILVCFFFFLVPEHGFQVQ